LLRLISLISLVLGFALPPVQGRAADCGAYVGINSLGSITNFDADQFFAQRIVVGSAAQATAIRVALAPAGAGQSLRAAIYTDSGSNTAPAVLLAQGHLPSPASGWNSLTITPIDLAPGTYWLALRGKKILLEAGAAGDLVSLAS